MRARSTKPNVYFIGARRLRITPDWFGGDSFAMPERALFEVTA